MCISIRCVYLVCMQSTLWCSNKNAFESYSAEEESVTNKKVQRNPKPSLKNIKRKSYLRTIRYSVRACVCVLSDNKQNLCFCFIFIFIPFTFIPNTSECVNSEPLIRDLTLTSLNRWPFSFLPPDMRSLSHTLTHTIALFFNVFIGFINWMLRLRRLQLL